MEKKERCVVVTRNRVKAALPRGRDGTNPHGTEGDGGAVTAVAAPEARAPETRIVHPPKPAIREPIGFDGSIVEAIRVNAHAARRRVAELGGRRTFKKEEQVGAIIRGIQCLDLTTLKGDDTWGRVDRLCAKALVPVRPEILDALGLSDLQITVGAVCVYPAQVKAAAKALRGRIPVASVATGFPAGQTPMDPKITEIQQAIEDGATEIDVVIARELALQDRWCKLYEMLVVFRNACKGVKMKTILGIGDLKELVTVAKAAAVAIMAGSDMIKTSTGFEATNATLEGGLVMLRQIRSFETENLLHGHHVGFKPAGGISTWKDLMLWEILVLEELGAEWLTPSRLRIGASGLLTDLENQLEHNATGRYAGTHRQPLA